MAVGLQDALVLAPAVCRVRSLLLVSRKRAKLCYAGWGGLLSPMHEMGLSTFAMLIVLARADDAMNVLHISLYSYKTDTQLDKNGNIVTFLRRKSLSNDENSESSRTNATHTTRKF